MSESQESREPASGTSTASERLHRIRSVYRAVAFTGLNTVLLFVGLNAALGVAFALKDAATPQGDPVSVQYEGILFDDDALRMIYPNLTLQEVRQLLEETWSRPYEYEAFTQFRERAFTGTFVNVAEEGFRQTLPQESWPPNPSNFNVFLFGGSTTFGYGVPDDGTIASFLQAALREASDRRIAVYNFGRGDYFSTQERILFERLLNSGVEPDAALFIDGLNDFHYHDEEIFVSRFKRSFEDDPAVSRPSILNRLPIVRLTNGLRRRFLTRPPSPPAEPEEGIGVGEATDAVVARVIDRYRSNKRMIEAVAEAHGVTPIFVWQPVPVFEYDLEAHLFSEFGLFSMHPYPLHGFPEMARLHEEGTFGSNFLWIADIQRDLSEPLYVDQAHYTARMSELVASHIARMILARDLFGPSP